MEHTTNWWILPTKKKKTLLGHFGAFGMVRVVIDFNVPLEFSLVTRFSEHKKMVYDFMRIFVPVHICTFQATFDFAVGMSFLTIPFLFPVCIVGIKNNISNLQTLKECPNSKAPKMKINKVNRRNMRGKFSPCFYPSKGLHNHLNILE